MAFSFNLHRSECVHFQEINDNVQPTNTEWLSGICKEVPTTEPTSAPSTSPTTKPTFMPTVDPTAHPTIGIWNKFWRV